MNRDDPKPGPHGPQRQRRVGLERKVSLKFKDFQGFITEYSDNLSTGGMFIRTTEPKEPGSIFDFELRMGDDYTLIHGLGEVVWVRGEDEGFDRPAGMGIRFLKLDEEGRELIDRIVADRLDRQVAASREETEPGSTRDVAGDWGMMGDWQEKRLGAPEQPEPSAAERPAAGAVGGGALGAAASAEATPEPPETESSPPGRGPEQGPGPAEVLDPSPPPPEGAHDHGSDRAADPGRGRSGPSPYTRSFHGVGAGGGGATARRASPGPRRGLVIALLVVVLLATAVAVYVIVDPDAGIRWALGGEEATEAVEPEDRADAADAPETAAVDADAPAEELEGTGEAAEAAGGVPAVEEPAGEAAPEPPPSAPAEPPARAEPEPPAPAPAEPPEDAEAFTRVQNVTWTDTAEGTEVTIHLDGAVQEWDYSNLRLDAPPPRHLVRVRGVTAPFPRPAIPVGGELLRQIRIGYHPKAGADEIHVVLDLADPDVAVEGSAAEGREIRLFLSRGDGA